MGPMYLDPSTWDTRMEVGPSAAPMIPMDAASFRSNPIMTGNEDGSKDSKLGRCPEQEQHRLA